MTRSRSIPFIADGLTHSGELLLPDDARAVVVLCHGLPSSGPRDPNDPGYAALGQRVADAGFGSFWFDFRGARQAPGDFSIGGWIRDLHAALDTLTTDRLTGALPRLVVGSSAGGAVAIAVAAARDDVAGIATLGAPATLRFTAEPRDVVLGRLRNAGLIREPSFPRDPDAWWAELEAFSPRKHAEAVAPTPMLVVHGDADDVVPYEHAEQLFAAARAPKELARILGAGHQLRRDASAVDCLLDWLDRRSPAVG